MLVLFAVGLSSEKVAQFFVNALAVAGGFLIGWLLTGAAAWFLDKRLTGGKSPPAVRRVAKVLGGVGLAIFIALIVFGHGSGWNFLGGGGTGDGKGTAPPGGPDGPDRGGPPATSADTPSPPDTRKEQPPPRDRVRVTVLGGDAVKNERFYLLDDDPTPRTIAEARATLAGKKDAAKGALGIEVRFTADAAIPPNHPAVLQLTNWARDHAVAVTFPADGK
jgi:hypothetical protein